MHLKAPLLCLLHLLHYTTLRGGEALGQITAPHDLRHSQHHLWHVGIKGGISLTRTPRHNRGHLSDHDMTLSIQ